MSKKGAYDDTAAKKNIDAIFAPAKKALNPRKAKGKSKSVAQQLLLAALHKQGFIQKTGEDYAINLTTEIEARWGTEGESNDTTKDVREVLERVAIGLKSQGNNVTVDRGPILDAIDKALGGV